MEMTFFLNLQLTLTGRQGLNATSCRTPVGFFYGYSHILPNDSVQAAVQATGSSVLSGGIQVPVLSQEDIQVKVHQFQVKRIKLNSFSLSRRTSRHWKFWRITFSAITTCRATGFAACCDRCSCTGTHRRRRLTSITTCSRRLIRTIRRWSEITAPATKMPKLPKLMR